MHSTPEFNFSIIAINYNSSAYIESFFHHLHNQTFNGTMEIIVINNLSSDNSLDILHRYPDISIIDDGINYGFSKGNNLGITKSRGEYIVCLNFDCFITENFLKTIYQEMESNAVLGMVSGKLYKLVNMKPTNFIDSTGIELCSLFPADRGEWQYDTGQYDLDKNIFGPSGAAAVYRRKALDDIVYKRTHFFDEEIFMYCEDIDLSWRLNLAGWQGLYVSTAVAFHERGATRKTSFIKKTGYYALGLCNRYFIILKNIRYADIKGNLFKLFKQETRSVISFFGRHPLRWLVFIYLCVRLLLLVIRPSFFEKRRLAHKYKKGDHLNLETGKTYKDIHRDRRALYPIDKNEAAYISSLCGHEKINNENWDITSKGINCFSRKETNIFISLFQRIKGSFFEIRIPEKHQEKINRSKLYIKLDMDDDAIFYIKAEAPNGKKHTSDFRVFNGGKGIYKLNIGEIGILPGSDGIEVWQNKWTLIKLVFKTKFFRSVNIEGLCIADQNEVLFHTNSWI